MTKLVAILLLIPYSLLAGTLSDTVVQSAVGNFSGASGTATLGATPTAGNILIATVGTGTNAAVILSSTNTTWRELIPGVSGPNTSVSRIFTGSPRASAGTVVTCSLLAGTTLNAAIVVAEFPGRNVAEDNPVDTNSGTTGGSPSVTISAANVQNALLVAGISNRGTWNAQQNAYSAPTNGFSIVNQVNTVTNTTNADRSSVMLVKLVSSSASVSAGVTSSAGGNFGAVGVALKEILQGFFVQ